MADVETFCRYRADRRRLELAGFRLERFDHLVRYTATDVGGEGLIAFAELTAGSEIEQIREQIAYFGDRRQSFEWKVHKLDRPANLQALLRSQSFVPVLMETLMVCPLHGLGPPPVRKQPPCNVRLVDDEGGVRDVITVQEQVWGEKFGWLAVHLMRRLRGEPQSAIYCAYAGDQPIGTGWIDFHADSEFADLHGGSVVDAWRRRGVYAELYRLRLTDAIAHGYRFLCADASTHSCPILERLGFRPVCTTLPMRYKVT